MAAACGGACVAREAVHCGGAARRYGARLGAVGARRAVRVVGVAHAARLASADQRAHRVGRRLDGCDALCGRRLVGAALALAPPRNRATCVRSRAGSERQRHQCAPWRFAMCEGSSARGRCMGASAPALDACLRVHTQVLRHAPLITIIFGSPSAPTSFAFDESASPISIVHRLRLQKALLVSRCIAEPSSRTRPECHRGRSLRCMRGHGCGFELPTSTSY